MGACYAATVLNVKPIGEKEPDLETAESRGRQFGYGGYGGLPFGNFDIDFEQINLVLSFMLIGFDLLRRRIWRIRRIPYWRIRRIWR